MPCLRSALLLHPDLTALQLHPDCSYVLGDLAFSWSNKLLATWSSLTQMTKRKPPMGRHSGHDSHDSSWPSFTFSADRTNAGPHLDDCLTLLNLCDYDIIFNGLIYVMNNSKLFIFYISLYSIFLFVLWFCICVFVHLSLHLFYLCLSHTIVLGLEAPICLEAS